MKKYVTKRGAYNLKDLQIKDLKAKLNRAGCDPILIEAWIAMGDWKRLGLPAGSYIDDDGKGNVTERPAISVEVRQKSAADLAGYLYPKLKAVEHSGEVSAVTEQRLTTDEIKNILVDDPFLKAKEFAATATTIKENADGHGARVEQDSNPRESDTSFTGNVPKA